MPKKPLSSLASDNLPDSEYLNFAETLSEPGIIDKKPVLQHFDIFSNSASTEKKKICFFIPYDWIFLSEDGQEKVVNNSNRSTVFLLLNTMIGSGILVQPFVFNNAGVVAAFLEYIIVGCLIFLGVELLIRVSATKDIFDYSRLAENILGPFGRYVVDISIVVNNAGALLSYILIIGSLLTSVVQTFSSCSDWYCNVGFLTVLPICVFTIPLCLIRNFGHLAIISYISIFVISAIMFLVIIGGPIRHANYSDDSMEMPILLGSFRGSFHTIGDIIFALGYITAIFPSYNAMEKRDVHNFVSVAKLSTFLGVLMCFFMGLVGYLSFRGATKTNILDNFPGTLGAVFKLGLIIHLILYIPGDFVIMRGALWKLFNTSVSEQSNFSFVSWTLLIIALITFIAVILQEFCTDRNSLGLVVDITGGLAGSILYFIVPGLCGMKLFYDDKFTFFQGFGLSFFGLLIMILVIIYSSE